MDYIENCKEVKSGLLTTKKIFEMIKTKIVFLILLMERILYC